LRGDGGCAETTATFLFSSKQLSVKQSPSEWWHGYCLASCQGNGDGLKTFGLVQHEIQSARSRILKNLEEGENLLNRMKGRPPGTEKDLLRMRWFYVAQQESLEKPAEKLQSILAEDQFVYMWNYSLVLLSNFSQQFKSGPAAAKAEAFHKPLAASDKARTLYIQGKIDDAAILVTGIVNELSVRGPLERP
jgi:hypothetical protein